MHRSKAAPPGARIPLLVFLVALLAGAAMFLAVHRGLHAAPDVARSAVVPPAHASAHGHAPAAP